MVCPCGSEWYCDSVFTDIPVKQGIADLRPYASAEMTVFRRFPRRVRSHPPAVGVSAEKQKAVQGTGFYRESMARIISPAFSAWSAMAPRVSARRTR
ncbi:hypothetical protein DENIS_4658 [Desulfonema ishimotonii]|uniref:Uncharacterized protein n=1 Tax=Desulfonema ishimotonii TaxID=45657 RepID=A0A401G353_9BACT|nr:hypothetical protein DENIS_4658 [Desulfonema ishimotonii]